MNKTDNTSLTLTMPRLGETMERGIVAEWLVSEGEAFKRGDGIIEFETDKTAVEYPALGAGVLTQQLVQPGDEVEVGAPIALIAVGDGPDWVSAEVSQQPADSEVGPQDTQHNNEPASEMEALTSGGETRRPLRATPVARRLALQAGVALDTIAGTGRRGRVEARDVESFTGKSSQSTLQSVSARSSHNSASDKPERLYAEGIAYSVSGPPTGRRFLLIHGFAADASAWSLLSRALIRAGCCVVSVDLPGHGATQTEALDVDSLHVGLQSVLNEIGDNGKPWHLVAHSLGASPALALAQSTISTENAPGRLAQNLSLNALSLIAPAGMGLAIDAQFVRGMAKPSSVGELSHFLRRLSDRPSALTASAVDELYVTLSQGRLVRLAESILGTQGQAVDNHLAIRQLSKQLPVRIIIGHADRIIAWQDALEIAPTVAVHHFPSAGHMPHWDYPSEVAEIILSGR